MKKMGGTIKKDWRKLSYKVGRKTIKATRGRKNQTRVKISNSRGSMRFLIKPNTATTNPAKNNTQTGSVNWIARRRGIYEAGRSLAGYRPPLNRTEPGHGCCAMIWTVSKKWPMGFGQR